MLAQTFTASADVTVGLLAQVLTAIVAALIVLIPVVGMWVRAKMAAALARAELERLQAEKALVDLRAEAEESKKIKIRLIDSVEAGLALLPDETRKKITSVMKAATGDLAPVIDKAIHDRRTEERPVVKDGE